MIRVIDNFTEDELVWREKLGIAITTIGIQLTLRSGVVTETSNFKQVHRYAFPKHV
jgi:hypothetical protein